VVEPRGVPPDADESSATVDDVADAGPSATLDVPANSFDGVPGRVLREMLGLAAVHIYASAGSALDVAHRLAMDGAPHATLVLADAQTRGRGRNGKHWASPPGTGIWLTLLVRPDRPEVIRVLTVRLGLAAATAMDRFATTPIRVKWPNDLYVGGRKLAGVLVEARWRGATPEWLAIGVGVNVIAPIDAPNAAGLRDGTERLSVLTALVPALLTAAGRVGAVLDRDELHAFSTRDLAVGRMALEPARGTVLGITPAAELQLATAGGDAAFGSGSLVLAEDT
jgi:BirA family biotin operon repressor/biotin-[acetyl-CoA-carboxylase] ligase